MQCVLRSFAFTQKAAWSIKRSLCSSDVVAYGLRFACWVIISASIVGRHSCRLVVDAIQKSATMYQKERYKKKFLNAKSILSLKTICWLAKRTSKRSRLAKEVFFTEFKVSNFVLNGEIRFQTFCKKRFLF